MSSSARFRGLPVSEGSAAGRLHIVGVGAVSGATSDEVRSAFAAVAADRAALARRLRAAGRDEEAAIIEVAAVIATDPALVEPAAAAVDDGTDADAAVRQAAEAQAAVLEALPSPQLAERAGDVRQVADAVLNHISSADKAPPPTGDFILIRREVGPADLIELSESGLVGAASVAGGASSHAAIIARGLGLPMIAGLDMTALAAPAGQLCILDATSGELILDPDAADLARAASGKGAASGLAASAGPARTADGREITVLCNVASAAETRRGLAAGAAGVGLLRTEIPFTGALAWPTLAEHRAQLAPILGLLAGRTATVRLLDFSGDKIPPFLAPKAPGGSAALISADPAAGLAALLTHRTALPDQLRAMLEEGTSASLSVLVPMVSSLDEVGHVREALGQAAGALGAVPPPLGIMVELQATAAEAERLAPAVDFFSIGTNDLAGQVLGLDRRDPAAGPALAGHPQVLALIAHVADAGREAGIPVSVCGDSAADPLVLPLLVGLGLATFSVPAARVQQVRAWLADLDTSECAALAARALAAPGIDEVRKLVRAR
jgi:phosphoenolpyruvate-protein kinase (PTS system EI component)